MRTGFAVVTTLGTLGLATSAFAQGGEDPSVCTVIPALPFSTSGTTVGYIDDTAATCPYAGSTSPDTTIRSCSRASASSSSFGASFDT